MTQLVQSQYSINGYFYSEVILFLFLIFVQHSLKLPYNLLHMCSYSIPRKLLSRHCIIGMCTNPQISQGRESQLKQVYIFLEYNLGKWHVYHKMCVPEGEFYILK